MLALTFGPHLPPLVDMQNSESIEEEVMAGSKGNKAKSQKSVQFDQEKTQTSVQTELPGIHEIPPNPKVIVLFHGLMAFTYNQSGFCEIGIHNQSLEHELAILVFEVNDESKPAKLIYEYKVGRPGDLPVDVVRIDVKKPSEKGAKFFKPHAGVFNRQNPSENEGDFRWVLDLEGPEFYNRPLVKKTETLQPRILIKHGVFYTAVKTDSTFKRSAPFDEEDLGNVAYLIGANIYFEADGQAALRIGKENLVFNYVPDGRKYLVLFLNLCHEQVCDYNEESPIKERRNDFYLYYKSFDIPSGHEEYELIWTDKPSVSSSEAEVKTSRFSYLNRLKNVLARLGYTLSTDEAPCGGVAFSRSDGLG
jgi:hypothetical protein